MGQFVYFVIFCKLFYIVLASNIEYLIKKYWLNINSELLENGKKSSINHTSNYNGMNLCHDEEIKYDIN